MSDLINNPIKDWLSGDRLYSTGLTLFRYYGRDEYPDIYNLIAKGNHGPNRGLMEHYLLILSKKGSFSSPEKHISSPAIKIYPSKPANIPNEAPQQQHIGDIAIDLNKKIASQKRQRLITAQSFQDCENDAERAAVCARLDQVNTILEDLEKSLKYYNEFGSLPSNKKEDSFELGKSYAELALQQNQTVSYKNKVDKKIKHALLFKDGDPKRAKLAEWQELYQTLLIRLQLIKDERQRIRKDTATG